MPKLSAGLLLYRVTDAGVEVLIDHPGAPFWARKDDGDGRRQYDNELAEEIWIRHREGIE